MARTGSSGRSALLTLQDTAPLTLAVGFSRHGENTGEDSHRVLCGCPGSGCHHQLATMPGAEVKILLGHLRPLAQLKPLPQIGNLSIWSMMFRESEFLNSQIRHVEKLGT